MSTDNQEARWCCQKRNTNVVLLVVDCVCIPVPQSELARPLLLQGAWYSHTLNTLTLLLYLHTCAYLVYDSVVWYYTVYGIANSTAFLDLTWKTLHEDYTQGFT